MNITELYVEDRRLSCSLAQPDSSTKSSAPALLLSFSSTRQSALMEHPYDLPAKTFLAAGHFVLSFDLSHHGERVDKYGEGIEGMCRAFMAGYDPFARFVADGMAAIDACLQRGIGVDGRICVCGVSRAGYCALRLAAADPRIKAVAGLAPVTDWRVLREWAEVRHKPEVAALALEGYAPRLGDKGIALLIGNQDDRVGTANCIRLALRLFEAEARAGLQSPGSELHVVDAPGHALPDKWREAGARYLLRFCS
jgi:dienelactone hydrolase